MKLKRYNQFLGLISVNENLDKAKKFLKEREIIMKAASQLGFISKEMDYEFKEGSRKSLTLKDFTPAQQNELKMKLRDIRLNDDEIKRLEQNPEFLKLRDLLSDNIGYLYNFVYMYFVENTPIVEIESMYKEILEFRNLMDKFKDLPEVGKKFDMNFIDTNIPNESEHRTNSEILAEGIEGLKSYRQVKKIIDTLPSKLKKSYNEAPVMLKEEFAKIAKAFDDLPEDLTDDKDHTGKRLTKKERVWKNFFGEMGINTHATTLDGKPNPNFGKLVFQSRIRRFELESNPIRAFIKAAKTHLESSLTNDSYSDRIELINKTQDRFGKLGANIVFSENGIIIVEVMTYAANKFLNSHVNHCIVNYASYWPTYLGDYNKQYYIYNTNIPTTQEESTIGVTIKPDRTWSSGACQGVSNKNIRDFKGTLKSWEKAYEITDDLFDLLKPMTEEEIEKRKKAKVAERKIIERGISIEEIKQYVRDDGADINKDNAKALRNAVEEDDLEKARVCLELGASPNHQSGTEAIISKAQNIDMIKLLVTYGSEMSGSIFKTVIHDRKNGTEALEFCLKAGMDPNFSNGYPVREARTGTYKNSEDIGEAYMDSFKLLVKYGATFEGRNNLRFIRWASEYARIEMLEYFYDEAREPVPVEYWEDSLAWMKHCNRIDSVSKEKVIKYLEDTIEGYKK
jgi:hypothetical protein